jgi:hypothetical protein
LRVIAAIPLAVTALRPLLARAQSVDALKAQYRYQKFPHGRQRCNACTHYAGPKKGYGTCSVLQAQVNWEGWCTSWSAKTH